MKKGRTFYIEISALLVILLVASMLLVKMYGASTSMSVKAHNLTIGVTIAENEAEAASSGDIQTGTYTDYYDEDGKQKDNESVYEACTVITEDKTYDDLYHIDVTISRNGTKVYSLSSSKYAGE